MINGKLNKGIAIWSLSRTASGGVRRHRPGVRAFELQCRGFFSFLNGGSSDDKSSSKEDVKVVDKPKVPSDMSTSHYSNRRRTISSTPVDIGGGREFALETGKLAPLADGSVVARHGETMVLTTACSPEWGFKPSSYGLPLMCDFRERFYSAGK